MENYRLFADDPIEGIRRPILGKAIPAALEKYQADILRQGLTVEDSEANIEHIAKDLAMSGFVALRGGDDEGQTDYELFHACVLAAILNVISPELRHSVYHPEDRSYDFIITGVPRSGDGHVKKLGGKTVLFKPVVYKFEFTEAMSPGEIQVVARNKMDPTKHDYRGRILLVGISFPQGKVDFDAVMEYLSALAGGNFEAVYVLGQVASAGSASGFAYFLAEMIKYKAVLPGGFELMLGWDSIGEELIRALRS